MIQFAELYKVLARNDTYGMTFYLKLCFLYQGSSSCFIFIPLINDMSEF